MWEMDRSAYNATTTRNTVFVVNVVFMLSLCRKGHQRMVVSTVGVKDLTITGDLVELACWDAVSSGCRTAN